MDLIRGLTFDTAALIALERRHKAMSDVLGTARREKAAIIIPAAVVAEWWRGRTDRREYVLRMAVVQELDEPLARSAGEALAWLKRRERMDERLTIDATVMATAALFGPNLYTGDFDDLSRFPKFFPGVRLFGVSA